MNVPGKFARRVRNYKPLPPYTRRALKDPRPGSSIFLYLGSNAMSLAARHKRSGPLLAIPDGIDPAKFFWAPVVRGRNCVVVERGAVTVDRLERAAQALLADGCELVVTISGRNSKIAAYRRCENHGL